MGVEFTKRHVRFLICDLRGNSVFQTSGLLEREVKENITEFLINKITEILHSLPEITKSLIGIGVAVPGHIDIQQDKVIINSSTFPGFSGKELKKHLPSGCSGK